MIATIKLGTMNIKPISSTVSSHTKTSFSTITQNPNPRIPKTSMRASEASLLSGSSAISRSKKTAVANSVIRFSSTCA
jgi:hypothetical protein